MAEQMLLYAWQPQGHGQVSFFVMARSEAEARAAVEQCMAEALAQGDDGPYWYLDEHHFADWGTEYYTLRVCGPGDVVINSNE